ncbi:hypothetical protein Ciccas_002987 [Cichlidogyrus casuarinus]|uniref:Vitellogenin domain-containing protein n=1 Tax=Cichlidogyrus casuarinus TaxID=1844966 RepID=A0ABD2QFQ9_9PLAT
MRLISVILLSFCLFFQLEALPLLGSTAPCSTECSRKLFFLLTLSLLPTEKKDIINFEPGKTYVYTFKIATSNFGPDGDKEGQVLKASGKAEISAVSACEMSIRLKEVKLDDGSGKEHSTFKENLENGFTQFGYDNGVVTGFCPNFRETKISRNIKAAIISHLQISSRSLEKSQFISEKDVSGNCVVQYQPREETPKFVIFTKTKTLDGCSKRVKQMHRGARPMSSLPTIGKKFSALSSEQKCEVKLVKTGVPVTATCEETIVVSEAHWTNAEDRLSVRTISSVEHESERPNGPEQMTMPASQMMHQELFFDHQSDKPMYGQKLDKAYLDEIAKSKPSERMKLFQQLVNRVGGIEDVATVASSLDNVQQKQLFVDALVMAQSEPGMLWLLSDQGTKFVESDPYFHKAFRNIKSVTLKMVEVLPAFLDKMSNSEAALSVGALVNQYCMENSRCAEKESVQAVVSKLFAKIPSGCKAEKVQEVANALLAIGNLGLALSAQEVAKLKTCFMDKNQRQILATYALDALRFVTCSSQKDISVNMLDTSYPALTRIGLFHARLKCLNYDNKDELVKLIYQVKEETNSQFANFVINKLYNVLQNGDAKKPGLNSVLAALPDIRNIIYTYYMGRMMPVHQGSACYKNKMFSNQVSRVFSTHVVFGTFSPLPSFVSINMAKESLEENIDLLEIGMYSEHLPVLEKFFGISRPLPENKKPKTNILSVYVKSNGYAIMNAAEIDIVELPVRILNRLKQLKDRAVEYQPYHIHVPTVGGFGLDYKCSTRLLSNFENLQ